MSARSVVAALYGFGIERLEIWSRKHPPELFHRLIAQLQRTRSLDYIHPLVLASVPGNLSKFDVLYIVLCRGRMRELDEDGNPIYIHTTDRYGSECWIAGFACLLFPATRRWQSDDTTPKLDNENPGDTADISIALLPAAQQHGYGRLIVPKIVERAFNTHHLPRVTASVVCPVRPSYSPATKKKVLYNTKQLCWIFEKFGFKPEGVSRGAVMSTRATKGEAPVWHDVYRLSMLQTDCFDKGRSHLLSHTLSFPGEAPTRKAPGSPWESMTQRQAEEKHDMESWKEKTREISVNDACEKDDGDIGDETVSDGDSGSGENWAVANDFDEYW